MSKFYVLSFVILLFSSCGIKISYLGNSFSATQNVDVFVDAAAIKKPYTIVGKGYTNNSLFTSTEKLQRKAIAKAKEKGANAILFHDAYIIQDGSSFQSTTKSDSVGKSLLTVQTGTVSPVVTTRRDIYFLRYN